jgi:hypothetical protein
MEKELKDKHKNIQKEIIVKPRSRTWTKAPPRPNLYFHEKPGAEKIIRQELLDDSLIHRGKEYIVELNSNEMYINGEKQSRSIFKKYKKIYEGVKGEPIDGTVKLIF